MGRPTTITTEEFIKRSKECHGEKYDYSQVTYLSSRIKVKIICKIHGEFWQKPITHYNGGNCPKCVNRNTKYTTREWVKKVSKVHKNKYDYSKVIYTNQKTRVKIMCPIHGEFLQIAHDHLNGCGCPFCGTERTNSAKRRSQSEFIRKAKEIHKNRYDYSKTIYTGNKNKVIIICKEHGEFETKAGIHLRGYNCPKCNCSKGEQKIEEFLIKYNIKYTSEKSFKELKKLSEGTLRYDFYLPIYNLCIEYQGIQHYEPISAWGGVDHFNYRKCKDQIKFEFCKNNKINFLEIPYWKFNKIENILQHELNI